MSPTIPKRPPRGSNRARRDGRSIGLAPWLGLVAAGLVAASIRPAAAQVHVFDLVPPEERRSERLDEFIARQMTVFNSSDPAARAGARDQLHRKAWRAAVPALLREIRSGKARPKAVNALLTLSSIRGEVARRVLRNVALDDQYQRDERLAAILALGRFGGEDVVRTLAALTRQSLQNDLRVAVALAAALNGSPRLAGPLRRLLPHSFRPTRVNAAIVLARHRCGADVAPRARALGRANEPTVRRVGCLIAADLDDDSSARILVKNLSLQKNDPWSAVCAIVALAERSPAQMQVRLRKALSSHENPVRLYAALALGWSRSPASVKALRAQFVDRRNKSAPLVRAAIASALARLEDTALLQRCLFDSSPAVRAAGVLMARHDPQSLPRLDAMLARETDTNVADLALTLRLVLVGEPLPTDHRLRRAGGIVNRRLAQSPWADLDRYRSEPGAPIWAWIRARYDTAVAASGPEAVKASLLNTITFELLRLNRFEPPERRVVNVPRDRTPIPMGRLRQSNDLSPNQKDMKFWLERDPYFTR